MKNYTLSLDENAIAELSKKHPNLSLVIRDLIASELGRVSESKPVTWEDLDREAQAARAEEAKEKAEAERIVWWKNLSDEEKTAWINEHNKERALDA